MINLPKELQVTHSSEILQEVSEELGIPITKVKHTFCIWLDYLEHLVKETPQATILIPNMGNMYFSLEMYNKLYERGNESTETVRYVKEKIEETAKDAVNHRFSRHRHTVPIVINYGMKHINMMDGKDNNHYYTPHELADFQNEKFFKGDRDFADKKQYKNFFFDD